MLPTTHLFVVGCLVLVVAGCSMPRESRFDAIRSGWTEADVRKSIGEPTVIVPGEIDEDGVTIDGPRWQYGDTLSTMTTAATFPRTIPDRVWVVWFDVDGLVRRTRRPVTVLEDGESEVAAPDTPLFPPVMPPRNR
ncbi:MAG: hypothetical protein GWP75_12905 [Planctomycetia bacterium]|jgi:hypothetical protein|nr:hypothetical protein [Planctomycetia bacterium]